MKLLFLTKLLYTGSPQGFKQIIILIPIFDSLNSWQYCLGSIHPVGVSSINCFILYIVFLVHHYRAYSPNSCELHMFRVPSSTIQAHLMPGTQYNSLGG